MRPTLSTPEPAQRAPAYVLGGGLIALGIVRSLGRHGIPITIFDAARDDITYRSRHVRAERLPGVDDEEAVIDHILRCATRETQRPVLFVAGDRSLLIACRHAERLATAMHVLLPPLEAAEIVVDKERFKVFTGAHATPVPRGWFADSPEALEDLLGELRFPLALKPPRSSDWQGPGMVADQGHIKMIRVDGVAELRMHWARLARSAGPPLMQELIRGDDSAHHSFISYRDRAGRELAALCVQKLRVHPIHGGLASFARIVDAPDMCEAGRKVLEQLGYRSAASVCFKRDTVSGEARIYEINGRLPLAHAIFRLAGIDLPWLMYRDAIGLPCEVQTPRATRGHWLALSYDVWAALEYRRAGELGLGAWLASLGRTRLVLEFDPRDPGPFLFWLVSLLRMLRHGARRRLRQKPS